MFLVLTFYVVFFFKIREQVGRTGSVLGRWGGGRCGWHQWKERGGRERGRRMNVVQTMYTHVCKCKNDTCSNCSRNQGRGNGGEQERWGIEV
jgi:hypothetical protein